MKKYFVFIGSVFFRFFVIMLIAFIMSYFAYKFGEKWANNHLPKNKIQAELRDLYINYADKNAEWYTPGMKFYIKNEILIVESQINVSKEINCKVNINTCGLINDLQNHWNHIYNNYNKDSRMPYLIFRNANHEQVNNVKVSF